MKILVVDDHPLILEALHHVLRHLDASVTVLDAKSADEGRTLAEANADADLMLLDLGLPDTDGFGLLAELRGAYPTIPVVVLSGSDSSEDVLRAIDGGAMGFIPKSSSNEVMLHALRIVLSGTPFIPREALGGASPAAAGEPRVVGFLSKPVTPRDLGLTDRQAQVLALMLQGKPNKLICRELNLAEGTVKIHVAAILRALNVANRTQAVVEASRLGLEFDGFFPREATT
ncbi:MAG: response regulator transcription factor [Burkholderiales bacterium]